MASPGVTAWIVLSAIFLLADIAVIVWLSLVVAHRRKGDSAGVKKRRPARWTRPKTLTTPSIPPRIEETPPPSLQAPQRVFRQAQVEWEQAPPVVKQVLDFSEDELEQEIGPSEVFDALPPPPPTTLLIATYNVRCDKDKKPHAWEQREPYVRNTMREAASDVICLQEARQDYAERLARGMGGRWQMTGQPRKRGDEGTQVLFSLQTMRFLQTQTFVLSDGGSRPCPPSSHCTERSVFNGSKCRHVRIFTHTMLLHRSSAQPVHVINTHFPLEEGEQQVCAELLRDHIREMVPAGESVVLCGDLNSHYCTQEPQTPLATLLSTPLEDAHGLIDFSTYEEGFEAHALANSTTHRLDFILFSPGTSMGLVGADMLNARYGKGNRFRPSDHELLRAGFEPRE